MSNKIVDLRALEAELDKVYKQIQKNPQDLHEDEAFLRISDKMVDFLEEFYYIEDD